MPEITTPTDSDCDEDAKQFYRRYREHARLQREVIEAAKKRHEAQDDYSDASYRGGSAEAESAALHQADCDLRVAILALIGFESSQIKK